MYFKIDEKPVNNLTASIFQNTKIQLPTKLLQCTKKLLKHFRSSSESDLEEAQGSEEKSEAEEIPPHCQIVLRCTREIAGFNGLGEVVRRLDFRSSVRNQRRFQYICALLKLLVSGETMITQLSGNAQRILLQMVEEVAIYVSDSQQNINVLRGLVEQLRQLVDQENQKCWGKPLGSQSLWVNHLQTIERIQTIANQIDIKGPTDNTRPQFDELPEECIRKIILHLSDHKDIEASAAAYSLMAYVVQEQRIWRELSYFHFTQPQIDTIFEKMSLLDTQEKHRNWQAIYHALRK